MKEWYKGSLSFKRDGKPIPVTFVKVDGVDGIDAASRAELIFHRTCEVGADVVLRPRKDLFIKQKYFPKLPDHIEIRRKGVSCVCYDRFEPLKDWADKLKLPLRTPDDRLQDFWRTSIGDLIRGVRSIHAKGFFHGGLHKQSSFVFFHDKLKVINVEGSLADLSPSDQVEKKKKDLMQLRMMLDVLLERFLGSEYSWEECSSFLKFFDQAVCLDYADCVEKLASHPFVLSSEERMGMFARYHRTWDKVATNKAVEKALRSSDFDRFKSWNSTEVLGSMDNFIKKSYDSHYGNYSGEVVDLLSFLRNLNNHYHQLKAFSVNVVDVDRGVQKLFPGFLELLYRHLEKL
ncbi:leucine-rich repeat receptor-like protein kinase PXL2 [Prunus yedoensis var. nudiflora]|uniref:Leucine-rich repeat receptor-like protein kinase PXL2 n=1 Tax=Prunus yedoensis var. nudiflora TaxID=2094558 RepID=A0A314ZQ38_PRUYE|nr:leucine-rich repeat receptor-like protein kinase PXL2 [Prunus yedoensis var. nudiflora]